MARFLWPRLAWGTVLLVAFCAFGQEAAAEDEPEDNGIPEPSIATSLPHNGDPAGKRAYLAAQGITYGVNYIGDLFGNVSGGLDTGTAYIGQAELWYEADLAKLWKWKGATFHFNVYQIHGREFSDKYLDNLMTVSTIEAMPTTRLFEIWFEQKFWDDKAAVRLGQLAADEEFMISKYGEQFINSTFGWTALAAADMREGGPAYPLATPGVRLKLDPGKNVTVMGAIFSGDPGGPGAEPDAEKRNRHGFNFGIEDGALVMAEAQFRYNQNNKKAGTIKVGGWQHFDDFPDQYTGYPLQGNTGVYAMLDQQLYALPGKTDADKTEKGIGLFLRISGAPSDRNLIDFYADGGLRFSGFIPNRPNDNFGIAIGYAQISDRAVAADIAADTLPRDYEAVLEISYSAELLPGWTLKPDMQYIWHPGGNVVDDDDRRVKNALVFGVRTVINY